MRNSILISNDCVFYDTILMGNIINDSELKDYYFHVNELNNDDAIICNEFADLFNDINNVIINSPFQFECSICLNRNINVNKHEIDYTALDDETKIKIANFINLIETL